ncbi:MAG: GGDEF domain-containing protein [Dehalococcoidia bacterium]|nr:GGDEF domain-containing protein [Dehalococcoidia bacterium]
MSRRKSWGDDQPSVGGDELWWVHALGMALGAVLVGIFVIAWQTDSTAWHVAWLAWYAITTVAVAYLANRPRRVQRELDRAWAARFHERSIRDELTGLHNRRYFHEAIEAAVAAGEAGVPFTLLFVDLNGFKQINDRFGHAVGDQALVHASHLLGSATPPEGTAARIGGDEFALVLPGYDAAGADLLAARIEAAFTSAPFAGNGRRVPLQVACGAGEWSAGMGPSDVLREADAALYRRKAELGRTFERRAS